MHRGLLTLDASHRRLLGRPIFPPNPISLPKIPKRPSNTRRSAHSACLCVPLCAPACAGCLHVPERACVSSFLLSANLRVSACLRVCLCLPVCLSVCLPVCVSHVWVSGCLGGSVSLRLCMSVCLCLCVGVSGPLCLCVCLCACVPVCATDHVNGLASTRDAPSRISSPSTSATQKRCRTRSA